MMLSPWLLNFILKNALDRTSNLSTSFKIMKLCISTETSFPTSPQDVIIIHFVQVVQSCQISFIRNYCYYIPANC